MTPSTEHLLLREVQPRLRNAIHTVPAVGSDDPEELLQDGLVIALLLLNGTRRSGKKVTAANVAYYTAKHLRSGRRSTGFRKPHLDKSAVHRLVHALLDNQWWAKKLLHEAHNT